MDSIIETHEHDIYYSIKACDVAIGMYMYANRCKIEIRVIYRFVHLEFLYFYHLSTIRGIPTP